MKRQVKQVRYVVRKDATAKERGGYRPMTILPRFISKLYDYSAYIRDRGSAI